MSETATPLYVVQALAEVREEGSINMLDRQGVAAICNSERARAWISKADRSEYIEALNDMDAYISGDMLIPEESETESDEEGDNYSY